MFDRIVERLLEAAQAEGTFDNLPGRGRPLALDGDENDPDWAAQRLLKHTIDIEAEIDHAWRVAGI